MPQLLRSTSSNTVLLLKKDAKAATPGPCITLQDRSSAISDLKERCSMIEGSDTEVNRLSLNPKLSKWVNDWRLRQTHKQI
jgi:hypothetical protein